MEAAIASKEKQFMGRLAKQKHTPPQTAERWLREANSAFDVVTTLSNALTPAWTIEREIDPLGDLTIVVLPTRDELARSAFAFFEDDGRAHVGIIREEIWQSTHAFPTSHGAVAAIIAAATFPG